MIAVTTHRAVSNLNGSVTVKSQTNAGPVSTATHSMSNFDKIYGVSRVLPSAKITVILDGVHLEDKKVRVYNKHMAPKPTAERTPMTAERMASAQLQCAYLTFFCPYPHTLYDALLVRATH